MSSSSSPTQPNAPLINNMESDSNAINMEPMGELDGAINSLAMAAKHNLASMSVKQLILTRWKAMKSWGGFIDTSKMVLPANVQLWSRRLIKNLTNFQSNYLCVFVILLIYCILTSPLLLLALGASLGACYIVALKNAERPVKFFGHKLSLGQQYLAIAICSLPLFYIVGAGAAVFWVIGASLFVIGLHASVYAIETVPDHNPLEEQFNFTVQSV